MIQDDGVVIWESNVIVRYLAAKYGVVRLWPEALAARAVADQWMDWQVATLLPNLTIVFWGLVRTPSEQRDLAAIDAATKTLGRSFAALDPHLADRPYVTGPRLTMGDILVGAACYRYFALPIERPALPRLEAWYEALRDRERCRTHVMIPLS